MARTIPTLGLQARHDNYGTTPTQRRQRRWGTARNKAVHRVKNGVNDTYTYFHLVDELATLRPWTPFTSAHLADWLNGHRPQFIWDAVTVGRILNDLIESFNEANPGDEHQPLTVKRTWSGALYELQDYEPATHVLLNLLDDLAMDVEDLYEQLQQGRIRQRLSSPLSRCTSLAAIIGGLLGSTALAM